MAQAADQEGPGAGLEKSLDGTFQEYVNLCWKENIIILRGGELATSALSFSSLRTCSAGFESSEEMVEVLPVPIEL